LGWKEEVNRQFPWPWPLHRLHCNLPLVNRWSLCIPLLHQCCRHRCNKTVTQFI